MVWCNVRSSVRLYFYVCYGLFTNQFIQFLRKKDQHLINKDFITSVFFYLRLHPALLREKLETEKQFKHNLVEDISLEWRQYCLDPLCTNFSQVVQNMLASSSTPRPSPPNKSTTANTNLPAMSQSVGSNSNASSSLLVTIQQQNYNDQQGYSPMPISPSFLFANTNRASCKFFSSFYI